MISDRVVLASLEYLRTLDDLRTCSYLLSTWLHSARGRAAGPGRRTSWAASSCSRRAASREQAVAASVRPADVPAVIHRHGEDSREILKSWRKKRLERLRYLRCATRNETKIKCHDAVKMFEFNRLLTFKILFAAKFIELWRLVPA